MLTSQSYKVARGHSLETSLTETASKFGNISVSVEMWLSLLYLTIGLAASQAFPMLCHPVCCNCGVCYNFVEFLLKSFQNAGFQPFLGGHFMMPLMPQQPRTIFYKIIRPINRTITEQKEFSQITTTTPSFECIETQEKVIKTPCTTEENIIPEQQTSPMPDQDRKAIFDIVESAENEIFSKDPPSPTNSVDDASTKDDPLQSK